MSWTSIAGPGTRPDGGPPSSLPEWPTQADHAGSNPAFPAPAQCAGLLRRFASIGYEAILVAPLLFIAAYLFLTLTQAARTPVVHALFQLWLLAVPAVYFVYCWRHGGQTLAMKTWHIRVARQDGSALSTREAFARFLLALWSLSLFGAGFWWGFLDRDRQFLHDRLVGTRLLCTKI